jgi:hypothetical protein
MTDGERRRWSLRNDLLLYLGALLLMLGLGTLVFDPKHSASSDTAAGILVATFGVVALVACLVVWRRDG